MASLIGCKIPIGPTLLGPNRKCVIAISFRSISVRKATESKIGKMMIILVTFKERSSSLKLDAVSATLMEEF